MAVHCKPRSLTLCLCLVLVIKASRAFAQEDYAGYRHESYFEDDHRMNIGTDTIGFDIGLTSHLRLAASAVEDAISGATPTGVPPVNQWPQATFNNTFPRIYQQNFNTIFNGILAAATDPNSSTSLYTPYFNVINPVSPTPAALRAFTNWVKSTGYQTYGPTGHTIAQDAKANATANATGATQSILAAQAQAIASNPAFRNSGVPLTQLSDRRTAYNIAPTVLWGINSLTPEWSYSREHDYHSYGSSLNYSAALNDKNTILNAGYSHDVDRVRDVAAGGTWAGKVSDDFLIGLNQLISPKSYFTVNLTYGQEYGYLSDQYRMAILDFPQPFTSGDVPANALADNRPRRRVDEILYANFVHFFEAAEGSADVSYRFFHDSYGIFANTGEFDWHQKLGRFVVFTPGIRYYRQTAATFYYILVPSTANDTPAVPNYSSDYRLSELESFNMSADFTFRIQKHISLDLSYMRYVMRGLDGATSQSAYPSASVYSIGARVWF